MHQLDRVFRFSKTALLLIALLLLPFQGARAQHKPAVAENLSADSKIVTTTTPAQEDQTAPPSARNRIERTVAQNQDEAWSMLTDAVEDSKHADLRIQALAALGTLGANPRSEKMIAGAMTDPDVDVRTAAILAGGQTKSRNFTAGIRALLDDKEPQVAFAAATTLWKMNDRSGEDILVAVANGDRSANPGMMNGTMHRVSKELHDPAALARLGALQGASLLLGPFGFGITAIEYLRKNGGDDARVSAIEQLSEEKTQPIRKELIDALTDKDPAVRAAAAKALGSYREKSIPSALLPVFDDAKAPVRLTAAAAYIRATEHIPVHKKVKSRR